MSLFNKSREFITPLEVCKKFGVVSTTLRIWADQGKIRCIKPNGIKRYYNVQDIEKIFNVETTEKKNFIYARVSSSKQEADLSRQVEYLKLQYPEYQIITDIGSGLNFKRKGLLSLLEQVNKGLVKRIVISYKDRIARFGFDLIEWLCSQHGTELLVLNKIEDNEPNNSSELAEDLLSIVNFFTARANGKKSAKYRKKRLEQFNKSNPSGYRSA